MIHSHKVAQVGQRIAQILVSKHPEYDGRIWPQAVYAAGMAHDLGHPPFGHVAEKELQSVLAREDSRWVLPDSFEGNAQTFRILTRLSLKSTNDDGTPVGLNLTPMTLAASTKYPWGRGRARSVLGDEYRQSLALYYEKKWGFYDSDEPAWDRVREAMDDGSGPYSINAQIMDLADDVTYAVHDVHDYFRSGLIPLDRIGLGFESEIDSKLRRSDEYDEFIGYARSTLAIKPEAKFSADLMKKALAWLAELTFPSAPYRDSMSDRRILHQFESRTVGKVQSIVEIKDGRVHVQPYVKLALETLKELTWFYVINHPHLSASQEGQRRIVRDLHEWLCQWADECRSEGTYAVAKTERNIRRLPSRFRELLWDANDEEPNDRRISRAAVDYIVGLTDLEAINLHHHLGGTADVGPVTWL